MDRTALVTGATSGVGEATAEAFVELGLRVLAHGRSPDKLEALQRRLDVETVCADLGERSQVEHLAEQVLERCEALHVLVHNAGVIHAARQTTVDGWEATLAVNHLAPFLLTWRLLPLLRASAPARVVVVSSGAHRGGEMHWDDLHLERGYRRLGFVAYSQSKLANVLFTQELARRLDGQGITANSLHPGFVRSGFSKNNGRAATALLALLRPLQISPAKGADTAVWLATSDEVEGDTGGYYHKRTLQEASVQPGEAERLWRVSAELLGLEGEPFPT